MEAEGGPCTGAQLLIACQAMLTPSSCHIIPKVVKEGLLPWCKGLLVWSHYVTAHIFSTRPPKLASDLIGHAR